MHLAQTLTALSVIQACTVASKRIDFKLIPPLHTTYAENKDLFIHFNLHDFVIEKCIPETTVMFLLEAGDSVPLYVVWVLKYYALYSQP